MNPLMNAYRLFAGWRSDPFFFDVDGVLNKMQFTGTDWFADKDICSIALELPISELGGGVKLNLWVRTLLQVNGAWVQADRGARPSQTPFMADAQREAYLDGEPAQDERFVPMFAHVLEQTGGYTPKGLRQLREVCCLMSCHTTQRRKQRTLQMDASPRTMGKASF